MSQHQFHRRALFSRVLWHVALFGFFLVLVDASLRADEDVRPNILLVTADDLGCELGCYGDRTVPTPHIDSLYQRGVRFDRAFVTQASCSPSRSSIFTGLYPHQNGQIGLSHRSFSMHPGQITFPALLKKAGYTNGVVGKIHVKPVAALPFDFNTNGELPGSKTNNVPLVMEYVKKFFADLKEGPFFLMVNFFDPHHPPEGKNNYIYQQINGLPEEPVGPEDVQPLPFLRKTTPHVLRNVPGYYNCVKRLDVGVGRLLDILKRQGHEDNTLVIFLGDHGPPFPGGKLTCYEAGLRVPFLVRWPGQTQERHSSSQLVSSVDILPTILEAAGITLPAGTQGRSLLPLLKGRSVPWREHLFGEFNWHTQSIFRPQRSVRNDRYKLIVTLDADGNDRLELFDLLEDPHEFENLAGRPQVQSHQDQLLEALTTWRRATKDPLLDRREINLQREKFYQEP